jgi:hypothetical protein
MNIIAKHQALNALAFGWFTNQLSPSVSEVKLKKNSSTGYIGTRQPAVCRPINTWKVKVAVNYYCTVKWIEAVYTVAQISNISNSSRVIIRGVELLYQF